MKPSDLSIITSYTSDAARYFAMSLADAYKGNATSVWMDGAIEVFKKAAETLGFDLVKRPAVDEAALEMHFSDGALPVTDKPGFDARDNSSIDDNVWSR